MKKHSLIILYITFLMIISQTELDRYVIFLAIPFLFILISLNLVISKTMFSNVIYLILILFIGFIVGILHLVDYNIYFFTRDIIYFIQAPIFILIGIYLYKELQDFKKLLKIIVLTSLIVTLYNLSILIYHPSLILSLGLETRYEYHLSNTTAFLSFIILFYARKLQYRIFQNNLEKIIIYISLFSILISFSRTFYLLLIIVFIIPYIYKKKQVVNSFFIGSFLIIIFVIFGGILFTISPSVLHDQTFKSKIMNSFSEIVVHDYKNMEEINSNWRGYEANLGLKKYYQGNLAEIIFGQGFGSYAKPPFWVFHGKKLDILPVFHNGYITILLKTGLIGLLIFFLFLWKLLQKALHIPRWSNNKDIQLAGLLLCASIFIIIFQTLVVHGIFKTTVPVLLLSLIGILIYVINEKK